MTSADRLVLQELHNEPGAIRKIASLGAISETDVLVQLRDLNDRVKDVLGYEDDPITVSGGALKADGVAGLLRLNSRVELEVVPKFLDPKSKGWRSDFFVLAVLVKTGQLLPYDEISASPQDRGDLSTLIAHSFLTLYAENERRPIRGYRRSALSDFALDGDVDWETIFLPDPDGFALSQLELTRRNPYNATLAAAVQILIPEVTDVDVQARLRVLARKLEPQNSAPAIFPPLPLRHQGWGRAYQLAQLIVKGLGLNLDEGIFSGPGFILSTWSAWEYLCEEIVRRALPDHKVVGQHQWILGHRGTDPVYAKPDISPMVNGMAPMLLDAKYKTRLGRAPRISAADLYESLAFLKAGNTNSMYLLYPSLNSPHDLPLGKWRQFDHVVIDGLHIEAMEIQVQGLATRNGFEALVGGARDALAFKVAPESTLAEPCSPRHDS